MKKLNNIETVKVSDNVDVVDMKVWQLISERFSSFDTCIPEELFQLYYKYEGTPNSPWKTIEDFKSDPSICRSAEDIVEEYYKQMVETEIYTELKKIPDPLTFDEVIEIEVLRFLREKGGVVSCQIDYTARDF